MIKSRQLRAIKIEDAQQPPILDQWNDDFGTRRGIAGNMPGECAYIGNDDRLPTLGGRAADASTQRNPNTGNLALKRA